MIDMDFADKLLRTVRYRQMTYEEQEAKAKELGIKSPHQMMKDGEILLGYENVSKYRSLFMVREEKE